MNPKDMLIAELRAELAALKARRCLSCAFWDAPLSAQKTARCLKAINTYLIPSGFSCSRWAAREEGK